MHPPHRGLPRLWLTLACLGMLTIHVAHPQQPAAATTTQTAARQPSQTQPAAALSSPSAGTVRTQQTVIVRAQAQEDINATNLEMGGLPPTPLQDTPAAALIFSRSLMDDQESRVLSDVLKNDASVGEDYAPVGWYQDFEVRGFTIDLASGFKIDGLTIAGEQLVPLENKQSVQVLEGLVGLEAGVASPGGLINYVTKRPALVKTLTVETDQRGTAYANGDLGSFFGPRQQLGLRTNFGGEKIRSYVDYADGNREWGTLSGDWHLGPRTVFHGDFEYQHQLQRSVGGYQLLGGTVVPQHAYPSHLLGRQPWAKPNEFNAMNASLRVDRTFTRDWKAYAAIGLSRSLLQDYIAYPYGVALDANGNSLCPSSPIYFFCPDGSYAVYDYRSPNELRYDNQFEALVMGHVKTGTISQDLAIGTSTLRRTVNMSNAVDQWVGNNNIYKGYEYFPQDDLPTTPSFGIDGAHEVALLVGDRIHLPMHLQIDAGGQYAAIHDKYVDARESLWLPQYAILYRPRDPLTIYGSYGVALDLGPQAPFWANVNPSAFLPPYLTRQTEIGAKYAATARLLLSSSLFRMRAPFFYPKPVILGCPAGVGTPCIDFVSEGHETHDGVELSAQGRAASWLNLTASGAAISGISSDTGTPAFDDKQIINLPRFRSALFAELTIPHLRGLAVLPGWTYTGRKAANRNDQASVAGYNLYNMGVRYTPSGENKVTIHLYADNISDKRYWKDTGASYGDTFLHPGAPTTIRLSTQYTF